MVKGNPNEVNFVEAKKEGGRNMQSTEQIGASKNMFYACRNYQLAIKEENLEGGNRKYDKKSELFEKELDPKNAGMD